MGRKGKTQKHTAKEITAKHKAAKEAAGAAGHGKAGQKARQEAAGKIQVQCSICLAAQPQVAAMRNHYEGKHPQATWDEAFYQNKFKDVKNSMKDKAALRDTVVKNKK